MDKVKEGKATKKNSPRRREVLDKARTEASEVAGIKLFVARLSFDVNEDELRNLSRLMERLQVVALPKIETQINLTDLPL